MEQWGVDVGVGKELTPSEVDMHVGSTAHECITEQVKQ